MGQQKVEEKQRETIVHTPVLKDEIWSYLKPEDPGACILDCTLGEGGYAELFLKKLPQLRYVGVDADANILEKARQRLSPYQDRLYLYNEWFNVFLKQYPVDLPKPSVIIFDLGISMYHYRESGRGFSFREKEELDMRLHPELELSASDIINTYPEEEIASILYEFGEERYSRQIAAAVARERKKKQITSNVELENIIWKAVPKRYRHGRIHPATRSFQALRIVVNGELERLKGGLISAFGLLQKEGRMGVISFHSLEDRITKHFFKEKNKPCTCPPNWPMCKCEGVPEGEILTPKPVRPGEGEVAKNKASRSARLRVIKKIREVGL